MSRKLHPIVRVLVMARVEKTERINRRTEQTPCQIKAKNSIFLLEAKVAVGFTIAPYKYWLQHLNPLHLRLLNSNVTTQDSDRFSRRFRQKSREKSFVHQ
jgi:hypothetical protein